MKRQGKKIKSTEYKNKGDGEKEKKEERCEEEWKNKDVRKLGRSDNTRSRERKIECTKRGEEGVQGEKQKVGKIKKETEKKQMSEKKER